MAAEWIEILSRGFWEVIAQAPWSFGVAVVIGTTIFGLLIFFGLEWFHREKYEAAREKYESSQERIVSLEASISGFEKQLVALDRPTKNEISARSEWSDTFVQVHNKHFRNERVVLDGKQFWKCKFENVTFVYKGIGPVTFLDASFEGQVKLDVEDTASSTLLSVVQLLEVAMQRVPGSFGIKKEDGSTEPLKVDAKKKADEP